MEAGRGSILERFYMPSNDDLINSIVAAGKQATSEADQAAKQARERSERIDTQRREAAARWPVFKAEFEAMTRRLSTRIQDSGFYVSSSDIGNQRELQVGTRGILRITLEPIGSGSGRRYLNLSISSDGDASTAGNVAMPQPVAPLNIATSTIEDFENFVLQFALSALKT